MLRRTIISALGIIICVLFFELTQARAAPGQAGHTAGHGAVGFGGFQSIHRGLAPGAGLGRLSARPFLGRNFVLRRHPRFRRFLFPAVWPECLWYGACYDVLGNGEPYVGEGSSSGSPPAVVVLRPSCRFQPETYAVPAEGGGERTVKVIRCLPAAGFPAAQWRSTSGRAITNDEGPIR
jgi:hypothetical protein